MIGLGHDEELCHFAFGHVPEFGMANFYSQQGQVRVGCAARKPRFSKRRKKIVFFGLVFNNCGYTRN